MSPPRSQERHIVERRLLRDRRRGLDRRIAERRVQFGWVEEDRRVLADRRRGVERRGPVPRRSMGDRRGSGLTFTPTDLTPS